MQQQSNPAEEGLTLFCGGLPTDCLEQELLGYFSQYGQVEINVCMNRETGRPRGFAFATFQNRQIVANVVANAANHIIRDKWIDVKEYTKGVGKGGSEPDPAKASLLFCGGLAGTVTDADLLAHFGQFGALVKAEVKMTPEGKSRGFAFLEYTDPAAVQTVLAQKASHMIHEKWVDVKVYGQDKGKGKGKDKGAGKGMMGGFGAGKGQARGKMGGAMWGQSQPAYSPYGAYGQQATHFTRQQPQVNVQYQVPYGGGVPMQAAGMYQQQQPQMRYAPY